MLMCHFGHPSCIGHLCASSKATDAELSENLYGIPILDYVESRTFKGSKLSSVCWLRQYACMCPDLRFGLGLRTFIVFTNEHSKRSAKPANPAELLIQRKHGPYFVVWLPISLKVTFITVINFLVTSISASAVTCIGISVQRNSFLIWDKYLNFKLFNL